MSKHHETPLGHCLGCVPVRVGVLAFASFLLFLSFCAVAGLVTEDTRVLVGGYTYWTNFWVDILGVAGVVLCLMGIVGVNDNHTRWVQWFNYYASLRVFAYIFIVWSDFDDLRGCEKFGISSLGAHYNAAMETVKLQGRCPVTRALYLTLSVLDILISLYGIWNTSYWIWVVDHGPMYHIAIDDTKPLRIYTGYSTIGHPELPRDGVPDVNVVPPHSPPGKSVDFGRTLAPSAAHLSVPQGPYGPAAGPPAGPPASVPPTGPGGPYGGGPGGSYGGLPASVPPTGPGGGRGGPPGGYGAASVPPGGSSSWVQGNNVPTDSWVQGNNNAPINSWVQGNNRS